MADMKAIFNCRPAQLNTAPIPLAESAYLTKLCNKPFIEYWLDMCVWLGIQEIRCIHYQEDHALRQFLGTGQDWGLRLSSVRGDDTDVIPDLFAQNRDFLDQDLILFDGLIFPYYDRRELRPFQVDAQTQIFSMETGNMRLQDSLMLFTRQTLSVLLTARDEQERFERWTGLPLDLYTDLNFQVLRPQSLWDFFQLNLQILNQHQRFHLKGFEVAPGIFEGINNDISERPGLAGPLLTGADCQLSADLSLETVVLHDQVRIESPAHLERCLAWGPVYLSGVHLQDKIIYHQNLINPQDGSQVALEQPYLLKQIMEDSPQRQTLYQQDAKRAQRLLLTRWPLYQLLRWAVPFTLRKFYLNTHGETLNLPIYEPLESGNILQKFFFDQGLQWVPFLLAVREQRLLMVGTRLMPADPQYLKIMQSLPIYVPGVFSHTMHLPLNSQAHWMEELHYASHVTPEWNNEIWGRELLTKA